MCLIYTISTFQFCFVICVSTIHYLIDWWKWHFDFIIDCIHCSVTMLYFFTGHWTKLCNQRRKWVTREGVQPIFMKEKSERNNYLQEKYHLYGMLNVDLLRVFIHNTQPLSLFMQRFSIHLGQNTIRKRRQWYLEWFLVQVSLNFISTHISNRLLMICSSWIMVSLLFENYIFVAIALIRCFFASFWVDHHVLIEDYGYRSRVGTQ